jgi:hypothetical protein
VFEEPVMTPQMIPGVYALTETFRSSVSQLLSKIHEPHS